MMFGWSRGGGIPASLKQYTYDLYANSAAADGGDGSVFEPFDTIAELATAAADNDQLGLVRDSVFVGTMDLTGHSGIRVRNVGSGDDAVIANMVAMSSATQEDAGTYPNVWTFTVAHAQASALTHPGVYVADADNDWPQSGRLRRVGTAAQNTDNALITAADKTACLANINSNSGRFYYEYAGGAHKYYVNSGSNPTSDSKYYWCKGETSAFIGNADGTVENVELIGAGLRNGIVSDNTLAGRTWRSVTFRDGGVHTVLAGGSKLWQDCASVINVDAPATAYHLNDATHDSDGAAYVRSKAYGPFALGRTDIFGAAAYYNHTSDIDAVALIDSESQGCAMLADYDSQVDAVYIIGAEVNTKLGDLSGQWPSLEGSPQDAPHGAYGTLNGNWYSENGLYYIGRRGGINLASGVARFHNERFVFRPGRVGQAAPETLGLFLNASSKTGIDVEFNYCTIVIDTYGDDIGAFSNDLLYTESGTCSGTIAFNDCILVFVRNNAAALRIKSGSAVVGVTMDNCIITQGGFSSLPMSGYTETTDIFESAQSWRSGDWTLSGTSPAIAADAGWRADRTPIYRPTAVAIARALGASVS